LFALCIRNTGIFASLQLCALSGHPCIIMSHNSFGVLMPTHCLLKIIYFVVNYSDTLLEILLVRRRVRFVSNVLNKDRNCFQPVIGSVFAPLRKAVLENVHHNLRGIVNV